MPILKSTEQRPSRGKQVLKAIHLEDGTELYPMKWAADEIGVKLETLLYNVERDPMLKKHRRFHEGKWFAVWPEFKNRFLKNAMLKGPKKRRAFDADIDEGGDADQMTFRDASTKSAAYKAELLKLEYEKEAGLLLPRDKVLSEWQSIATIVSKAMLTIPDRLAPILAADHDPDSVYEKMTKEIRIALTNLDWKEGADEAASR